MNGQGIEARIARLERDRISGVTYYRLPDGTTRGIRTNRLIDVMGDVIHGRDSPGARLLLEATECSSGRLHEVAKALTSSNEVPEKGQTT